MLISIKGARPNMKASTPTDSQHGSIYLFTSYQYTCWCCRYNIQKRRNSVAKQHERMHASCRPCVETKRVCTNLYWWILCQNHAVDSLARICPGPRNFDWLSPKLLRRQTAAHSVSHCHTRSAVVSSPILNSTASIDGTKNVRVPS